MKRNTMKMKWGNTPKFVAPAWLQWSLRQSFDPFRKIVMWPKLPFRKTYCFWHLRLFSCARTRLISQNGYVIKIVFITFIEIVNSQILSFVEFHERSHLRIMIPQIHMAPQSFNWSYVFSITTCNINRLFHRKFAIRIFVQESQNFRNEQVSVANEWVFKVHFISKV